MSKISIRESCKDAEELLEKLLTSNPESFVAIEIKDTFLDLLSRNTPIINLLVVKNIAEITKNVEQRGKFSTGDVLEKLMELLEKSVKNREMEMMIQLCRAFGNIFYSNDDSRNIIFHHDGGAILVRLFDISHNEIKSQDELQMFSKVRSGVTSNYLLGNEELSSKAIEFGIINKLKARIDDALNPLNDEILSHLLPIFSILTEQVSELIFDSDILERITKIYKNSKSSDVIESCLELFQCQAESDDVKLLLAKEGICEHIFKSLNEYKNLMGNVDAESLVKLSCDLIVLILTGDEAMEYLDQTPLLKSMAMWLDSSDNYVMTTSVLAFGNYARNDDHCIKLVEDKTVTKLIDILRRNNGADADARLQHSLVKYIIYSKRNLIKFIFFLVERDKKSSHPQAKQSGSYRCRPCRNYCANAQYLSAASNI